MRNACAAFAATFLIASVSAQQTVPFANGIPVAPEMPIPAMPTKPVEYATAEGMKIKVSVVTRGIEHPWSIAFVSNDVWLVTQTHGGLRVVRNGVLDPEPVKGVPDVKTARRSGLLEVTLHPKFAENKFVYLTYHKPLPDDKGALALARGRWDGKQLVGTRDLFVTPPDSGTISRLVFGRDGKLYMSTAGGDAQDPSTLAGKILRLNDDGTVPKDNPFVGRAGYRPEIYTLGHRSPLGLAVHPVTGQIWECENGPNGGDEVNILVPGGNYGWPLVSLGRTYQGPWHSQKFQREGFIDPVVYWTPAIAVSGLTFYTGDKLPKWKGDLFVGGLRYGEVIGTGQIQRILFNEKMEELRREALLTDWRHRMRDVREGPDGLLYVLIDDDDGAVLRIEPAS
ncbi:MAG: PQQ-dependent sugar dehydrogenase [Gammaproteobacteria bacterium]